MKTRWARLEREKESKRRNTKGRSWEIQSMRDWTDCNISSSKLQLFKKEKKKRRSPEPCRFVSEGEKPAVRSNRPLIFLPCIKGTILLGGYAGEQALLIFTVYLTNVYIHLHGISPKIHFARFCSPLYMGTKLWCFGCTESVRRITASYFSDKTSLAVINPPKAATKWFNTMPQKLPRCPSSLFCLCVGSLARLMFRVGKRNQESICWWRGMAVQLM